MIPFRILMRYKIMIKSSLQERAYLISLKITPLSQHHLLDSASFQFSKISNKLQYKNQKKKITQKSAINQKSQKSGTVLSIMLKTILFYKNTSKFNVAFVSAWPIQPLLANAATKLCVSNVPWVFRAIYIKAKIYLWSVPNVTSLSMEFIYCQK